VDKPTWITKRVYDYLDDSQNTGPQSESIWNTWKWSQQNKDDI